MVNIYMALRTLTVVLLAVLGLATLITGMILATAPHGPGSGRAIALGLTKGEWSTVHELVGFAAAGVAVLHVYVNHRALIFHFKRVAGMQPGARARTK